MKFNDKIVLITGASSGIGEEVAYLFASKGADLILIGRRIDRLNQVKVRIEEKYREQRCKVIRCDVSKKEEVLEMSKDVLKDFKYIDILVNNAGFAIFSNVINTSIEEIKSQIETNLLGAIYCIKAFLPIMLERNFGRIVNVASLAASIGVPNLASYCASKFGLLGFSQALYHELHGTNVRISVVSPITVKTEFFNHQSFKSIELEPKIALSANSVAKAILRAINSKRLEITVPFYARGAIWLTQTLPYLTNPIVRELFIRFNKNR